MTYKLTLSECPKHGFKCISLDDENGGYRLTPSKCCGSWVTKSSWQMSESALRRAASEFLQAADELANGRDVA